MTHPVLPKLKPNHNVTVFNESGKWDVRTRDALFQLSSGLKVDKVESEISSIPDMWARPMLFEMALRDPEHILHERILGEWRGLLAMLGLKEVIGLNRLTAAPVILPPVPQTRDGEEDEDEAGQRDFLLTLSKLLPKATLSSDTSWRTLYIFLFNGQPIGMTSPSTLVVTAADYLNRINSQEVGWYNGNHLKDPVKVLPPRHRQILSGWLDNLIRKIGGHRGIDRERWDRLVGLLNNFRAELGAGECNLSQSGFGIQGQEAGIFKYLDKPADGNIQDASHVRLISSPGRTPAKPLLVFERSIAEQWDMLPQDVTVDGAQTLASPQVQVKNAEVWKGADFFTKKLFVIYQENAFPETLGVGNRSLTLPGGTVVSPILPLNSNLMQYLSIEDLAQRVRWDQTPEGLRIRLFLQLSGPDPKDDKGRRIELTKLYYREDIHTLDNVPILEIWPNFKADGWKAYYTCYSTDDITATFAAKPFTLDQPIDSEAQHPSRNGKRRYWRTETYPESIICRASALNAQADQMEDYEAGLLLLTPPKTVQDQGRFYKIGVDFGASSTTICARFAEQSFPIKFENRKVSVTASGDKAQAQLFDFFLPRRESEMPVLSFFQDFHNTPAGQDPKAFLNGHAYLLETAELFDPNARGLAFDLKWSAEKEDRKRVVAFLTQLCLQTAAELRAEKGATGASWAFSYPTAFSVKQRDGFPALWKQVTANCATLSGLKQEDAAKPKRTESEAAALYFVKHRKAATQVGTIFMDIGGSTSDISVWQGGEPVWQTSVLLAGRNIFSNYMWHNPDFLGAFGVDVTRLPEVKRLSETDRRPYYALTDALLRYNSERIFDQLPVHTGTNEVRALRQHLALGISGLFFYVGSLLQYLMDKGIYQKEVPNIYVGGNGSRIFRWLDIDGEEHINELYKAVFSQGAGWTDEHAFKVMLSPEPKKEAAFGLLFDDDLKSSNFVKVLAGESFIAEGIIPEWQGELSADSKKQGKHELGWRAELTAEALTLKLSPPQEFKRIADFVAAYNRFANISGLVSSVNFTIEHAREVRRRLGQSLGQYQGATNTANIVVEPVFIVALREWLEIRLEA